MCLVFVFVIGIAQEEGRRDLLCAVAMLAVARRVSGSFIFQQF